MSQIINDTPQCRNCMEPFADDSEVESCFHCGFQLSIYTTRKEAFRAFQTHLKDPDTIVADPHRAAKGWVISHARLLVV